MITGYDSLLTMIQQTGHLGARIICVSLRRLTMMIRIIFLYMNVINAMRGISSRPDLQR